jgi:hypothetical protein
LPRMAACAAGPLHKDDLITLINNFARVYGQCVDMLGLFVRYGNLFSSHHFSLTMSVCNAARLHHGFWIICVGVRAWNLQDEAVTQMDAIGVIWYCGLSAVFCIDHGTPINCGCLRRVPGEMPGLFPACVQDYRCVVHKSINMCILVVIGMHEVGVRARMYTHIYTHIYARLVVDAWSASEWFM